MTDFASVALCRLREAHERAFASAWHVPPTASVLVTGATDPDSKDAAVSVVASLREELAAIADDDPSADDVRFAEVTSRVQKRLSDLSARQRSLDDDMKSLQLSSEGIVARSVTTLQRVAAIETELRSARASAVDAQAKILALTEKSAADSATIATLAEAKTTADQEASLHRRRSAELECALVAATERTSVAEEACATLHESFRNVHESLQLAVDAEKLNPVPPPAFTDMDSQVSARPDLIGPCSCRYIRQYAVHLPAEVTREGSPPSPAAAFEPLCMHDVVHELSQALDLKPVAFGAPSADPQLTRRWAEALERLEQSTTVARPQQLPAAATSRSATKRLACAACHRSIGGKPSASCSACGALLHASCVATGGSGRIVCPSCNQE